MRLTAYTDYSLRLLMYLAVNDGGSATISAVADAYAIPKNHLTKVAHHLVLSGHVASSRGRGGGLRLGRPAEQIVLGTVVRQTEPDFDLVPCFAPDCGSCAIAPACGLTGALRQATQAFLAVLDRYSIADLVTRAGDLRALLGLPAVGPPIRADTPGG